MSTSLKERKLDEMREVFLKSKASGPGVVYYVLRFDDPRFGPEPNITIIPPARIGKEYPKTYGHYHEHGESETYRVLYGRAVVLMQKLRGNQYGEIEDAKLLTAETGRTINVPKGYGHCLINTTDDLLITADWEAESAGHIYEPIKEKHGMAYYLVEGESGSPKAIPNSRYENLPPLTKES